MVSDAVERVDLCAGSDFLSIVDKRSVFTIRLWGIERLSGVHISIIY